MFLGFMFLTHALIAASEFILQGNGGIYKTGEQIIPDRLTTSVGDEASTKVQTLTFDDEEAVEGLQQFQTVTLSGTSVNLDYCEIEQAISVLDDQYVIGSLTAKIVSPRPGDV